MTTLFRMTALLGTTTLAIGSFEAFCSCVFLPRSPPLGYILPAMNFTLFDWTAIVLYLGITLMLGLYFRSRSGKSVDDYFVSGRNVSWWLAGTSMVATTFAADTPLVVTGLVYTQGIAGNWLWWAFLLSGMMTVFLFARLWRRSGLLTDVQFAEMRYSGKPAAFLRGFRAIYLGLLMNCLILGWVTKAMTSIVAVTLGVSDRNALAICVLFLIPFTGLYVALGGLWGVLWTDLFQFALKMAIVIGVAWYAVAAAGGMSTLLARLAEMRAAAGPGAGDATAFFPDFSRPFSQEGLWLLPVITFVVNIGLQWWAFWYPGAEPGGGGYIAQRIFSAKDEKNGLLAVLWFNVAHYALRPWPWILTALAAVVLYPHLEHPETGYMLVVSQHVPPALRGIVIAGFMAAFMSTIATQLNWGASYLVSDFYRRFIKRDADDKHYVLISRLATVLLVIASAGISVLLSDIRSGWQVVLEVGAGTGGVYLLRWYWWRINAWSEVSAMIAAMLVSVVLQAIMGWKSDNPVDFAWIMIVTVALTTLSWLVVTFATPPESQDTLVAFYRRTRPSVAGWRPIAALAPDVRPSQDGVRNLVDWIAGCVLIYGVLFGVGKLLLKDVGMGVALLACGLVAGAIIYWDLSRRGWSAVVD
jgi:solute:Na+ symporter, SSS family